MRRKRFTYDFPRPMATADIAVFSVGGGQLRVLLVERGKEPFKGRWALPGGFVDIDEDLPVAAMRELEEETGLKGVALEPLGTYGKPGRDPRGRTISAAYLALVPFGRAAVRAGDDAARAVWHPVPRPPSLAFDHDEILTDALNLLREKVLDGDWAFRFLPDRFTSGEAHGVFEAVTSKRIPVAKFRAEMKRLRVLEKAPGGLVRPCRRTLSRLLRQRGLFRF